MTRTKTPNTIKPKAIIPTCTARAVNIADTIKALGKTFPLVEKAVLARAADINKYTFYVSSWTKRDTSSLAYLDENHTIISVLQYNRAFRQLLVYRSILGHTRGLETKNYGLLASGYTCKSNGIALIKVNRRKGNFFVAPVLHGKY